MRAFAATPTKRVARKKKMRALLSSRCGSAANSALTALFGYQLQRLHRTRPKAAFILGIAATGAESALVARSAWIARQAGR